MYEESRKNGLSLGVDDNFVSVAKETANKNTNILTNYVGSTFNAIDSMSLNASRDINIKGSALNAGNNLLVSAGRDISVLTGQGESSNTASRSETKTGVEVTADSNTASVFAGDDTQDDTQSVSKITQLSSEITAGNNVLFDAGNDIAIQGSNIGAGKDILLNAVNDISIITAQERTTQQSAQEHTRDGLTASADYNVGNTADAVANIGQGDDAISQASSLMQAADTLNNAGPSASAHFGRTTTTTKNSTQQDSAVSSNLLAGGNVAVNAGGDALFEGANVSAVNDISVSAINIDIIAAQNTHSSKQENDYLQTGANLNANANNASLTVGFSQSDSTNISDNTQTVASQFSAGSNMQLNAEKDLSIEGSNVSAGNDLALIAGNDISIIAHETSYKTKGEDSHLSANAGINFGANGVGVTANMAMGEGKLDRSGTQYRNSHVSAGNSLTVISDNDTALAGANLVGSDVNMDIGGNLTVASVQNTGTVDGKRWDASASITVGAGVTGGGSVGYGETTGETAWVGEQSSIVGTHSVNIDTQGHTQIDGALIANIDESGNDTGNFQLSTGTIGYSDIFDVENETSSYLNIGFTTGDDNSTNQKESGNNYSVSGNHYDIDKEQSNLATIGNGNITVDGQNAENLEGLNRDSSSAQQVTKDDSSNTNLYATTTAADSLQNLAENPSAQLDHWQDNVTSVVDADAWGQVAENGTDALADVGNNTKNAIEAAKREIQTWGDQVPPELQTLLPEFETLVDEAIREGRDIEPLKELFEDPNLIASVKNFAPLANLADTDPELLKEQLKEGIAVSVGPNEQGEDVLRIAVKGTGNVPAVTQMVDGINSLMKVAESVPEDAAKVMEMALVAAGGAASIVMEVATEVAAQTEAGQTLLTKVNAGLETMGNVVGSVAAGSESLEELEKDVTAEKKHQDSDYYRSMQGGGNGVVVLVGMLAGVKSGKVGNAGTKRASEFEQSLRNLPAGERVAQIKIKTSEVALELGWKKESKLTKRNGRDVYRGGDGFLYAVDTQHGRFEKINAKNGKHLGEVDIDLKPIEGKLDPSGKHDLKVK